LGHFRTLGTPLASNVDLGTYVVTRPLSLHAVARVWT
jgi:hypothetical protein